jgi:hypothetical protein
MGAPVAGIIEESAFRGYMQGPIERRYGLLVAILITGTMFAIVHLDFTPILWPYYVAVAAIYGTVGLCDELDSARHRAAHGWKCFLEPRPLVAWSGRMADAVRRHTPDLGNGH